MDSGDSDILAIFQELVSEGRILGSGFWCEAFGCYISETGSIFLFRRETSVPLGLFHHVGIRKEDHRLISTLLYLLFVVHTRGATCLYCIFGIAILI